MKACLSYTSARPVPPAEILPAMMAGPPPAAARNRTAQAADPVAEGRAQPSCLEAPSMPLRHRNALMLMGYGSGAPRSSRGLFCAFPCRADEITCIVDAVSLSRERVAYRSNEVLQLRPFIP